MAYDQLWAAGKIKGPQKCAANWMFGISLCHCCYMSRADKITSHDCFPKPMTFMNFTFMIEIM